MKTLGELLGDVSVVSLRGSHETPVPNIRADSRLVEPGDLFICLPGYRTEGGETRADRHDFIPEALARGAAAVVVDRDVELPQTVGVVRTADNWRSLASIAAAFNDHPSRKLVSVAVTGTSGKTSTTYLVDSMLTRAGHRVARLGTIEYKLGNAIRPAGQTTPEAHELQSLLREALEAGDSALVMEVSSHALELHRVGGIAYDVAVFTNLSQDHLNFHPDMQHYRRAKARLFEDLGRHGKPGIAVINRDDPEADFFLAASAGTRLTYGLAPTADVRAEQMRIGGDGVRFLARTPAGSDEFTATHLGDYSVYNALAAIGAGIALGLSLDVIREGVAAAPQVPGRLERVDCGQDFLVAVDYAHKPGALERVLQSARALCSKRIITVFGCGGDRDRAKRPLMGAIAAAKSDAVVVTSDNPRTEEPSAIIAEILAGIPNNGTPFEVEPDRARAIGKAIDRAETGDLVLIAGKGHENYQILGQRRIHFDDREVARAALEKRLGR